MERELGLAYNCVVPVIMLFLEVYRLNESEMKD